MGIKGFGIICSEGQPFEQILDFLQPFMERPNIRIEFLRIENTPIPEVINKYYLKLNFISGKFEYYFIQL